MAWRFVRQPDGLLARFSDIVDSFTDYGLTEQDALALCKVEHGLSSHEAMEKVKAGVEDWKPFSRGIKGNGLDRWNHCIQQISQAHGEEEVNRVMSAIGLGDVYDHSA